MVDIASYPIVYSLEGVENNELDELTLDATSPLVLADIENKLGGVDVVKRTAHAGKTGQVPFSIIRYYTEGNRDGSGYKVWI